MTDKTTSKSAAGEKNDQAKQAAASWGSIVDGWTNQAQQHVKAFIGDFANSSEKGLEDIKQEFKSANDRFDTWVEQTREHWNGYDDQMKDAYQQFEEQANQRFTAMKDAKAANDIKEQFTKNDEMLRKYVAEAVGTAMAALKSAQDALLALSKTKQDDDGGKTGRPSEKSD